VQQTTAAGATYFGQIKLQQLREQASITLFCRVDLLSHVSNSTEFAPPENAQVVAYPCTISLGTFVQEANE
jgi:hypothetical protein